LEKALKIRPICVFVLRKSEKCDKKIVRNGANVFQLRFLVLIICL